MCDICEAFLCEKKCEKSRKTSAACVEVILRALVNIEPFCCLTVGRILEAMLSPSPGLSHVCLHKDNSPHHPQLIQEDPAMTSGRLV